MATLPDPKSLPHFQWIDEQGRIQPLHVSGQDLREITDYVIDSNDWPSKKATVQSVLTKTTSDIKCEVCGKRRDDCKGQPCIDYFRDIIAPAGKRSCDIKGAGEMGKGVFANRKIPGGSVIGEYLGKLHPLTTRWTDDKYIFLITEIAEVSALRFGNLTRFVNHHCNPNIKPRIGSYGKRQVVLYEANRDIRVGEQLFVDYGLSYFSLPHNPCKCDAQVGEHLPGKFKSQASIPRKPAQAQGRKHSEALPDTLTRRAGVSKRSGPQVYAAFLREYRK